MNLKSTATWAGVCLLVALLASPAWAIKERETGERFPDKTTCNGHPARAAGAGVREATFGVDVYGVVLYVDAQVQGKSVRKAPGCIKLHTRFVRDVGAGKIRKAWVKGFKKHKLAKKDPAVQKFLSIIKGEMKEHKEMIVETHDSTVVFRYMNSKVTIADAAPLAKAIKDLYMGANSPTPTLVKDLKKRGIAKP